MVMVYATGHLSGAHINPAVTLAFTLTRHFPGREAAAYVGAQLGGRHRPPRCCSAPSGRASPAHLGATVPSVGAGQRVRLRGRADGVPDVRDHGRGHRHPSGRRRRGDRHRRHRRARRPVRRAGHRRVDEPGPLAWARPGERRVARLLGLRRRPVRRRRARRARLPADPGPAPRRRTSRPDGHGPLRLPAQRRALADEPGALRARGGRAPRGATRRARRRASASIPRWSRSMRELGIDLADRRPAGS